MPSYIKNRKRYIGRRMQVNRYRLLKYPPLSNRAASIVGFQRYHMGYFKLSAVFQVVSDGSGNITNGFRVSRPDAYDGSNAVTDWSSFANLYDMFRVKVIAFKFIPQKMQDPSNVTTFNPAYMFADFDSVGLTPTIATVIGYDNVKVSSFNTIWKYYIKIPKLIATSGSYTSIPGYFDTASTTPTGSVYLRAEGLSNSTQYGKLIVKYYIIGMNRK